MISTLCLCKFFNGLPATSILAFVSLGGPVEPDQGNEPGLIVDKTIDELDCSQELNA